MENRSYAIAVGLFAIMLGIATIFAFWWLSGSREEHNVYLVESKSPVSGLNPESAVKFRGVNVGKVAKIWLDTEARNDIHIQIEVSSDLKLSERTYGELRLQGITGLAYIELNDPDPAAPLLQADAKIPLRPSFLDKLTSDAPQLVEQIAVLVKNSSELAASANQVMNKLDTDKLNRAIGNLEKASAGLQPLIGSAGVAIHRFGDMVSEKNQLQLRNTLQSLEQTSKDVRPLIGDLRQSAHDFSGLTQEIGQGTRQLSDTLQQETLPRIHELTGNLEQNSYYFNQLMQTVETHPQSLLTGRPRPAPGPGEAGYKP
jgi:phospholipid/cholesterol/gamma-HCH transport system substrate-binding protein